MLKNTIVVIIAAVAIAIASVNIARTMKAQPVLGARGHAVRMPAGYSQLATGKSQQQVEAMLGKPIWQGTNRKFEHKSNAEWATLEAQLASTDARTTDTDAALSLDDIRRNAQMEHRIKYIWVYKPTPLVDATLRFDENGILLRWDYSPALHGDRGPAGGGAPGRPGGAGPAKPAGGAKAPH